jgi:signal peptidase I
MIRNAAFCRSCLGVQRYPSTCAKRFSTNPSQPVPTSALNQPLKSSSSSSSGDDDYLWLPSMLSRLAAALGIIHIVHEYGLQPVLCEGPSMLPTIQSKGEIILVDKCTPRWFPMQHDGQVRAQQARIRQGDSDTWHHVVVPVNQLPKQDRWIRFRSQLLTPVDIGDIVVVQHPDKAGTVCKRILALPGDMIVSPPGGRRRSSNNNNNKSLLVIPDGHIWLEGDNPRNSNDSRDYGPVPAALIVGRVMCRIWPMKPDMMLERGGQPDTTSNYADNQHTILPAGYQGEELRPPPNTQTPAMQNEEPPLVKQTIRIRERRRTDE